MNVLSGYQWIAGEKMASGSETFKSIDPRTEQEFGEDFFVATKDEVNQSVEFAAQAFQEYSSKSGKERANFLRTIADEIEALGQELIERAMAETGLPEARLLGERGRTCAQLRMFADLVAEGSWVDARIDRALPERTPVPKPDLRRMLIALGPVAVFGASNFPLAFSVAGGDTASALAAGNTVIVKGHPAHPGTSELVARAINEATEKTRMPKGVFNLVHGFAETGAHLVNHHLVEAVGFTGSLRAGRALYDLAAKRERPIPVFAEMGSINPVFILPSGLADAKVLAEQFVGSLTMGCGQFCTNPGLVVAIDGADLEEFTARVVELIAEVSSGPMLTPGIRKSFVESSQLRRDGGLVRVIGEGKASGTHVPGIVFSTTARQFVVDRPLHEEIFGPSALIVHCADFMEMQEVAVSLDGQLTTTIHSSNDDEDARSLVRTLAKNSGRVLVNGFPTGVEVCPSMQHGGPYPASTDSRFTSVGTAAIFRFCRPVSYQNLDDSWLPAELQNSNPLGILRQVNGNYSRESL